MVSESILIKLLGAASGAIIALVFLPPKTAWGFARRGIVSLICGPIFAPVTHGYVGWPDTPEYWLAASAFTAGISWWTIGIGTNVLRAWVNKKAGLED